MSGNILALSGGGFRGLYTVRVLRRLEERLEKPLADHFDLITGTSIGGIIALGIAAGIPLKTIEDTFHEKGRSIFPKPIGGSMHRKMWKPLQWIRSLFLSVRAIFNPIHSASGLEAVLIELFGDRRMKDLVRAKVAVTAANLSTGSPKMFKTPHHDEIYLDENLKVVDVALATSAAPVFFPIHQVSESNTFFADGALMGNSPGLFGWLEAKTRLNVPEDEIYVLSIGTLAGRPSISSATKPEQGVFFWLNPRRPRLMTFLMSQQEHLTDYMLKLLLNDRYHLIDGTVSDEATGDIDLDDASDAAASTLISHAEKHFSDFTNSVYCKTHFPREAATHA
ncbi:patatin [Marinobacter salarius]|uniref:CBASS cGAMP-activated phospholipase n=1 Tax=Marinobacter salarius TaxID=1420917 RepID=UPI001BCEBF4F|nr:CBASS cGAMP-activated phospholipase [Marinobacter salarius]MBS8232547.1 patatin [Marinobacter salarius]